jgi:parallel beta-helix repeat protein
MLALMLNSVIILSTGFQRTAAEPATIIVPDDFPTIQEAINAASDGDKILVRNGTYSGPIVVDKVLALEGENRESTIIDGGSNEPFGSIVLVLADNVEISGFTIQHCRGGGNAIWLDSCVNMTFSDNIVTGCNEGVRIFNSSGTVVSDSIVQDCYYNTGVGIDYGFENTVCRNTIIHNHYGISGGIDCHGNTYSENTIINNDIGFGTTSYDSKFFHNNFVNNGVNVVATGVNEFDEGYPSGGNYWSDYAGEDLRYGVNQSEIGSDGIGDSAYVIDASNVDNYPLMRPYVPYENQTIYIRADGSIDPSGAPILRNGDIYTLTGNITSDGDGIMVEKDDVALDGAGYSVTGSGSGKGASLIDRRKVTIRDMTISNFFVGIFLISSNDSVLLGNDLVNNSGIGVWLTSSFNNTVLGNNTMADNGTVGVWLVSSCSNTVSGNSVASNSGVGVYLDSSSNNNVSGNNVIDNYACGVYFLLSSSNNTLSGNNIANNGVGVHLYSSSNNTISESNITANRAWGLELASSSNNNSILGTNITNNLHGVYVSSSSNNSVSGNNIMANRRYGVWLAGVSPSNVFFHNNFINNTQQVLYDPHGYTNFWDDGYPSGGNYWSDYNGSDSNSDRIGDTSYVIDAGNRDKYPLMIPYGSLLGDVNGDGYVGMDDIYIVASHFSKELGDSEYSRIYDMNGDGYIGVDDIFTTAKQFGKEKP